MRFKFVFWLKQMKAIPTIKVIPLPDNAMLFRLESLK